jgi:hypothetical protein
VDISGVLNATGLYVNNSPVDLSGVVYASSLILNNTSLVPSWSNPNITDGSIFYNNGAVGINNSSPQYHLDCDGTVNARGDLYCGQYMGIGTTSPAQLLHINGTQPNILVSASGQSTDNKNWTIGASGTHLYGAILNDGYTSDKIWLDVQRTGMNITKVAIDSRLVGIGKTNPTFPLDVSGNMNVSGSTYLKNIIQDDISNNTFIGNCFANKGGINCVAIGNGALNTNAATSNTAVGFNSSKNTTYGNFNTALGTFSLFSNTSGYVNTAIGFQSLATVVNGFQNTALGSYAGFSTTGSSNTFIGQGSGFKTTTGEANTFLGHGSGSENITGSYNTLLGESTDISGVYNYSTAIGYGAQITASNTIVLGRNSEKRLLVAM